TDRTRLVLIQIIEEVGEHPLGGVRGGEQNEQLSPQLAIEGGHEGRPSGRNRLVQRVGSGAAAQPLDQIRKRPPRPAELAHERGGQAFGLRRELGSGHSPTMIARSRNPLWRAKVLRVSTVDSRLPIALENWMGGF